MTQVHVLDRQPGACADHAVSVCEVMRVQWIIRMSGTGDADFQKLIGLECCVNSDLRRGCLGTWFQALYMGAKFGESHRYISSIWVHTLTYSTHRQIALWHKCQDKMSPRRSRGMDSSNHALQPCIPP